MKNTRLTWGIAGLAGLLSTLLFATGFIYAIQTILNPKGEDIPTAVQASPKTDGLASKDQIRILALGDSLTKGVGDTSGEGYVGKVRKLLEQGQDKKQVYVWNFAVNGYRTEQLLEDIGKPSALSYVEQADVVLLTIGGNDLNRFASSPIAAGGASSGAGGQNPQDDMTINMTETKKRLPEALDRLNRIITKLAEKNPKAKILYVGLYHPYLDFDPNREGSELIQEWNHQAFLIANRFPNVTVIPTYDIFQNRLNELLFTDHFHPNGDGYSLIADRVMQVLK